MSDSEHTTVTYTSVSSEDDFIQGSPEYEEQPLPAADTTNSMQSPRIYTGVRPKEDLEEDDRMILRYPADYGVYEDEHLAPAEPAAVAYSATHTLLIASRLGCLSEPRRRHQETPERISEHETRFLRCGYRYDLLQASANPYDMLIRLKAAPGRKMPRELVEQRALISGLQAADHQRQVQLTMALKLLKGLQTQMAEFQRQQGPAEGPAQPDAPEEAGSCS
ncbi:hypothetical protein Tco_0471353 [Tanacetum coccineum]